MNRGTSEQWHVGDECEVVRSSECPLSEVPLYIYIVYTINTDPVTSQVMLRDLWDPPLNIKNTSKRNTNSVGSRAWDSVVDGFESLVSLAEQAWLTPAQLISVVILTWTWMLCRRIGDGSHSMYQGVQGKCITNTVTA